MTGREVRPGTALESVRLQWGLADTSRGLPIPTGSNLP